MDLQSAVHLSTHYGTCPRCGGLRYPVYTTAEDDCWVDCRARLACGCEPIREDESHADDVAEQSLRR